MPDTIPNNPSVPLMPNPPNPAPRRRRWPLVIGGLAALLIVFGVGGFVTASALEDHDSFCISCHTVPETTYFNRAYIAVDNPTDAPTDLASVHYLRAVHPKNPAIADRPATGAFACIECHRGDSSLGNRTAAILLGARDSVTFVAGGENPALAKTETREGWLSNAACLSCHTNYLLTVKGRDNHFHTLLPQAGAAVAAGSQFTIADAAITDAEARSKWLKPIPGVDLNCTSCHLAHTTLANGATTFYMDTGRRNEACVSCHVIAHQGPQSTKELGN